MKIAVLSDIHANLAALTAVQTHLQTWQPDHVVVNGDSVNRGPEPMACWQWLKTQHDWVLMQGNHETYVLNYLDSQVQHEGAWKQIKSLSQWTFKQMTPEVVAEFAQLPTQHTIVAPDGTPCTITHASARGNRDNLDEDNPPELLKAQIGGQKNGVFCIGHTHVPFVRPFGEVLIVNCGAVGQPCDGDLRASYAQIEWQNGRWHAHIARVPYDRAQTKRAFLTCGLMEACAPISHLLLAEWEQAYPFIMRWREQKQTAVINGELDITQSVQQLFQEHQMTA